ncbi:hypothetical protein B9T31_14350 [Acinetobacter sp. ANC 4558]|uniref:DUF4198 domain-containing protein n=1 Tax=Acinetobacter sp. ANC 4558 TaxID=1977876 RepID=UPI000A33714E|nr:DUF4198 domain-containing protein [Acinetobacter sp. ANC 4558]OTG82479.1 hypothetical protein B9T31_14350 [Acinetobacter sp. ANC 4558]
MKRTFLALLLGAVATTSMAHSPFVAPYSYLVDGENTGIVAGFAEQPFDSEIAIRGYDFKVINPNGEIKDLTLINSKAMSIADIEAGQEGTYQVIGSRVGDIKYAKQGNRWLRVMNAEGDTLAPIAERNFITPAEVNSKTQQHTVKRYDQLSSFFTKKKVSKLNAPISNQGLNITFSEHPNHLSLAKPLSLKVSLNQKPASNYQIELEKQPTSDLEKAELITLVTNQQGEIILPITAVGQYVVSVTSPEQKATVKPNAESHRSILSFYVNP